MQAKIQTLQKKLPKAFIKPKYFKTTAKTKLLIYNNKKGHKALCFPLAKLQIMLRKDPY